MLQTGNITVLFLASPSFCEYFPFSYWFHVWLWGILEFYHPYSLHGLKVILFNPPLEI